MRGREFVMKDMYSMPTWTLRTPLTLRSALARCRIPAIFGEEGLGWSRVEADTGNIGGMGCVEYQVHATSERTWCCTALMQPCSKPGEDGVATSARCA